MHLPATKRPYLPPTRMRIGRMIIQSALRGCSVAMPAPSRAFFWAPKPLGLTTKRSLVHLSKASGDGKEPGTQNDDENEANARDSKGSDASTSGAEGASTPLENAGAAASGFFSSLVNNNLREPLMSTGAFVGRLYSQIQNPILEKIKNVPLQKMPLQKIWRRQPQLVEGSDEIGLGFSAGGLLFPYYIGVVDELRRRNVITDRTKIAGSSAGSIIAVCNASGMSMSDIQLLCFDLMKDCREKGTPRRLGIVLRGLLEEALPENIHERAKDTAFVGVTLLTPVSKAGPLLVSEYRSRDDLIDAVLCSAHIPLYLDGSYVTRFREHWGIDGGLTDFIPEPDGVGKVYRVTCFPISGQLRRPGIYENLAIAPDLYATDEVLPTLREFVQMAFFPAEEGQLHGLIEMGRRDAAAFVEQELLAPEGMKRSQQDMREQKEEGVTGDAGTIREEIEERLREEPKEGGVPAEASRTPLSK